MQLALELLRLELGEVGPRRRAPYAITDRGREAFLAWLEIDPGPDVMRSPFLLKFFFAPLLPEETMRRSFLRLLNVVPRDYRQRFPG